MELEALQEFLPQITAAGANLIAISPQRKEFLRQLVKKHNLTFDLLSDEGNSVAKLYGLVFSLPDYLKELYIEFGIDLPRFNGDDSWTLPMPARFIIDRNSIIRSNDADPDYTIRPEPEQTIEKLKALKG
jgi:peroxiredoxin